MKECDWCFNEFMPKQKVQRFCCTLCAKRADNERYRSSVRERAATGDADTLALLAKRRERKNSRQRKKWAESAEYRSKQRRAWISWYRRSRVTEGLTIYG